MADTEVETTEDTEQEEEQHTGVMIAFFLSAEDAAKIALPVDSLGAKDMPSKPEELHLTLAYFGDTNNHSPETKLRMLYNLKWFAESYRPLTGLLSGLGIFNSAEAPYPLVALFDSPMLEYIRMGIKACMQSEGIYPAANHGFTPHVTLAYLDKLKMPAVDIPNLPLTFGAVSLAWGNERYDFPLGSFMPEESFSQYTVKATQANYGAKAGQAIRGNLIRGADGKFGSGGKTPPVSSTPKKGTKTEEAKAKAKGANAATQKKLEAAGLGKTYPDGTFDLTPAGRSLVKAGIKGDSKMAKRALATAQAQADKKAKAAAKKKTKKEIATTPALGSTFKAYKDSNDNYRWIISASSGFQDKDKQYVTTKALKEDVERSYREHPDRNFGPLNWWHVNGLQIGTCDFRGMTGHTLIESGTFTKKEYAEAMINYSQHTPLGASLGFQNLIIEPDHEGAFNWITTKERSLLPAVKASNWLARFFTTNFVKKEKNMLPEKIQEFHKAMGGSPEALAEINSVIAATAQIEKAALEKGLTVKETTTPAADELDDSEFIDTMTVKEFQGYVTGQIATAMAPVAKTLETVATLLQGQQTKETAAQTELTNTIKSQGEIITQLQQQVAALTSETPKAFNSLRASQTPSTINPNIQVKENTTPAASQPASNQPNLPGPDSKDDFLGNFLGQLDVKV